MEKFALVCIDYEARADLDVGRAFAAQTLASVGARVLTAEFTAEDAATAQPRLALEVSDALHFERGLPSMLSDEAWARVTTTASSFWNDQPVAFKALQDSGHVHVASSEEWIEAVSKAAQDYVDWEMGLAQQGYAIIHTRDTMSSDAIRHASFLEQAGAMPPPYLPRGTRYGQVGEWDYSLAVKAVAQVKPGVEVLKSLRETYSVPHSHIAQEDAHHAAYEVKDALAWIFLNAGEFEALVHTSPRTDMYGDAAMRAVEFLRTL